MLSPLAVVFALLGLPCAVAAVRLYRRYDFVDPLERWLAAAAPLAGWFLAVQALAAVLKAPSFIWNDIRLARAAALVRGYRIYLGPAENGPVIGTLHAPVSHLLYTAIAWISDPTYAMVAGAALSALLVFGPVFWLHLPAPRAGSRERILSLIAFLACALAMSASSGTRFAASMIHADAAALGLATLAAGLLYHARNGLFRWRLWISALCAAAAVGSKQTMAPLLAALPLFLLLAEGPRAAMRYLIALAAGGVLLSAVMAACFGPEALWFNIVTLAGHRPPSGPAAVRIAIAIDGLKKDALAAIVPALFLALYALRAARSSPLRFRANLAANRWTLFLLAGILEFPLMLKAMMTEGGDINQYSLVSHFLFLSVTMCLWSGVNLRKQPADEFQVTAAKLFCAVMMLLSLNPGAILALPRDTAALRHNATQAACDYLKSHPGKVYFTSNPLAILLAGERLYHCDFALHDREIAGHPLTAGQFRSGLPASFEAVALPLDCPLASQAFQKMLSGFRKVMDPQLPWWTLYIRRDSPDH